jgi:hypothetical protein
MYSSLSQLLLSRYRLSTIRSLPLLLLFGCWYTRLQEYIRPDRFAAVQAQGQDRKAHIPVDEDRTFLLLASLVYQGCREKHREGCRRG